MGKSSPYNTPPPATSPAPSAVTPLIPNPPPYSLGVESRTCNPFCLWYRPCKPYRPFHLPPYPLCPPPLLYIRHSHRLLRLRQRRSRHVLLLDAPVVIIAPPPTLFAFPYPAPAPPPPSPRVDLYLAVPPDFLRRCGLSTTGGPGVSCFQTDPLPLPPLLPFDHWRGNAWTNMEHTSVAAASGSHPPASLTVGGLRCRAACPLPITPPCKCYCWPHQPHPLCPIIVFLVLCLYPPPSVRSGDNPVRIPTPYYPHPSGARE